jgi:pre-mRNA-splicing factor CDC5/CEF1
MLTLLITEDNVLAEARNLHNVTMAQTPLLGEENTSMHLAPGSGTGFTSATPQHQVAFTPNPLATPMYGGATNISNTPREDPSTVAGTPLRTPHARQSQP